MNIILHLERDHRQMQIIAPRLLGIATQNTFEALPQSTFSRLLKVLSDLAAISQAIPIEGQTTGSPPTVTP
jgi:hypothetical protein